MRNLSYIVTSGATFVKWDDVRGISNKSKGATGAVKLDSYFGVARIFKEFNIHPFYFKTLYDLESSKASDYQAVLMTTTLAPPKNTSLNKSERERLRSIINSRDAVLIEDNAYELLAHNPFGVNANKNIMISSFSKVISPELRLGMLVSNYNFKEIRSKKITMNLSTNSLVQMIAWQYLHRGGMIDHWKQTLLQREERLKEFFDFEIDEHGIFVQSKWAADDRAIEMGQERGIALDSIEGHSFKDKRAEYIRINLGAFSIYDLDQSRDLLNDFKNDWSFHLCRKDQSV